MSRRFRKSLKWLVAIWCCIALIATFHRLFVNYPWTLWAGAMVFAVLAVRYRRELLNASHDDG